MIRVKDSFGRVHFRLPTDSSVCLCGKPTAAEGLLPDVVVPYKDTHEEVNCQNCAVIFTAVKNQPWGGGAINDDVLKAAIYITGEAIND